MNVYVSGVLLREDSDYTVSGSKVTFSHPPQRGELIDFSAIGQNPFRYIVTAAGGEREITLSKIWQDTIAHNSLMNQAWDHREHPMVADALERLQSAIALVEE